MPTEWPDEARAFALSEARVGVLGVLGSLPVRWINHPAKDSAANYKPVQLGVAARAGLEVPRRSPPAASTDIPRHQMLSVPTERVIK